MSITPVRGLHQRATLYGTKDPVCGIQYVRSFFIATLSVSPTYGESLVQPSNIVLLAVGFLLALIAAVWSFWHPRKKGEVWSSTRKVMLAIGLVGAVLLVVNLIVDVARVAGS